MDCNFLTPDMPHTAQTVLSSGSLPEPYAVFLYIYGMHISPYEKGNIFNKDPLRIRKLLLHRYEINKIEAKLKEKGLTLVPLKVYFKDSLVKVEIGMARGKKLYDKRQDIAKKDQRREAERDFKVKNLY